MPDINNAYIWAVNTCNAPNIGYSQSYRNQQTIDGVTYYDCSSFIWYALRAGGFDVVAAHDNNTWPFTTYDMAPALIYLGFTEVDSTGEYKAGDIGLSTAHTEMCYEGGLGNGIFMGAHTGNAALANQVSIGSSSGDSTYRRSFPRLFRYGDGASGGTTYEWINGRENEYFGEPTAPASDSRTLNNAACILQYFYPRGWTVQAIAALCGNVQQESTFNPNLIEIGGTGHGLVQWTPPTDLYAVLDVLYGSHDDWYDGEKQCHVIYAEYEQKTGMHDYGIEPQWYETPDYPISWYEWAHSTGDPGELALAFQANYERPASLHSERAGYARAWYDYLITIDPTGSGSGTKKKVIPLWMMIRYR